MMRKFPSLVLLLSLTACLGTLPQQESINPVELSVGEKHEVKIIAKALWQNSGIKVEPGYLYDIGAAGRWSMGPICGWTDASGAGVGAMCADGSVLIGRIGRNAQSFKVGNHFTLSPKIAGTLYLRAADLDSMAWVNSGSMQVTIRKEGAVRRKAAPPPRTARIAPRSPPAPPPSRTRSDVDTPGFKSPDDPDKFALVIGIENYRNLPRADYAERDAKAMHDHLRAAGYPERNIIQLLGQRATISDLKKYIEEWLPRNIKSRSSLFGDYSGHGAPNPTTGDAYIVPWDGDAKFLRTTGYPLKKLYASLSGLKARRIIVALDACFSGAGGRSVLAKGARPLVTKVDLGLSSKSRLALLTAASGDEITGTLDDQGHGLFTYFLLKGLNGAAKDAQGRVTMQGLYDYLKPLVQDEARRDNREQTPTLHTRSDLVILRH